MTQASTHEQDRRRLPGVRRLAPLVVSAALLWAAPAARAGDAPAAASEDPLASRDWPALAQALLGEGPRVFDPRVRVLAPAVAEDSMNLPLWVDASDLGQVERLVLIAERNPIPRILDLEPLAAPARVGIAFKVQQGTPVRAAALTADGVWHIGSTRVDAAGGGCTAPSLGSGNPDWSERLGQVEARLWPRGETSRLRARVHHPMDTGLAAGIPAFYIEALTVLGPDGSALARLALYEPVSENPILTLDLPAVGAVTLRGRDNNGNPVRARVLAPEGARP